MDEDGFLQRRIAEAATQAGTKAWGGENLSTEMADALGKCIASSISKGLLTLQSKPTIRAVERITRFAVMILEQWEPPETLLWSGAESIEDRRSYRRVAALLAMQIRDDIELLHQKLDNDDQMKAFNTGIRNSILDVLASGGEESKRFVNMTNSFFIEINWPKGVPFEGN